MHIRQTSLKSKQTYSILKRYSGSTSNFSTWLKRLREEGASASAEPATFIPLEVTARDSSSSPSKDSIQNQKSSSSDIIKTEQYSGLTLHVDEGLTVSIDKEFHEPTLQRLVRLFTSGAP